ncbi:hypothetical protein K469DRAFT_592652, partial [Zopfia rhizophila CBS 207.26]
GDAHPRVTGCPAVHEGFFTIEEAREYMTRKGVSKYKEVIKNTALETTPERSSMVYYAVCVRYPNGKLLMRLLIKTGALEEIHEISGACQKRFRTKAQLDAFIEDWKESFAEVWSRAVKEELDQGIKPRDMKLSIEGLMHEGGEETVVENIAKQFDTKLGLDETKD